MLKRIEVISCVSLYGPLDVTWNLIINKTFGKIRIAVAKSNANGKFDRYFYVFNKLPSH